MSVTLKIATFAVINKLEAITLIGHLAQAQLPNICPGKITLINQITVIIIFILISMGACCRKMACMFLTILA